MALPNLIIIGAPKCATTSMHAYLATHPQIFMTAQKELHYFLNKPWGGWRFGREWYERQFEAGRDLAVRGESSPGYSIESFTPDVVEKMFPLLPDAKLIYMLRDPLQRAQSHYTEELYNKHIPSDLSLQQILEAGPNGPGLVGENFRMIVYTSLYRRQLEFYLRRYPLERIHFVTMEEMKRDLLRVLQSILRFLEVDQTVLPRNLDKKLNEKSNKRFRVVNPTALVRHLPGYERFTAALPNTLKTRYRRAISRELDQDALMRITPDQEERLRLLFRPDVEALRGVTGRSFDEWSV